MADLLSEIRHSLRQLARRPGINALAVLSLALGIGVNSSMFSLVDAVLLDEPALREPHRLVEVYTSDSSRFPYSTSSYPDYVSARDGVEGLEGLAAFSVHIASYDDGERTRLLFGEVVSGNFFGVLGVQPSLGRSFLPEEDSTPGTHPVVILGNGFWKREMAGDPEVLGRTLELNGLALTIVGVAPPSYRGTMPGLAADYWVPMQMHDALAERPRLESRGSRAFFLKGRLADGVALEQAQARFDALAAGLAEQYPETNEERRFTLVASEDVAINPGIDGPIWAVAGLLLTVVGLVLLIACSNIANLLLARAADRRREIAVRLALGAGRGRLVRQLLSESLLLALSGGALGLLVAVGLTRLVVSFQPPLPIPLALDLGVDARVLTFTLLIALATGLACGLAPALRASRPQLAPALRDESLGVGRGHRKLGLRNVLVVAQVMLSTVLLLGAGLFLRSLGQAQNIDPGFDLRRGATAMIALGFGGRTSEAEGRIFFGQLLERAEALPGVTSAALAGHLPLGMTVQSRSLEVEGRVASRESEDLEADFNVISPGYLSTLGVAVPWGRDFTDRDQGDSPGVVIVNEEAARRFWPGQSALGKRLRFSAEAPWLEVVGITETGKYRTLGEEPRPFLYRPFLQEYSALMTLVVRGPVEEAELLRQVHREIEALDPSAPIFDLRTVSQHLGTMLFPARMGAALLAAFGLLGLLLACLGLYGVVAYSVSRRTREVGVRLAIGAGQGDVLLMVIREGMALVGLGMAFGVLAAFGAGRLVSNWLYGVEAYDPITFLAVPAVLGVVALLANLVPARRATRIDPMAALRYE